MSRFAGKEDNKDDESKLLYYQTRLPGCSVFTLDDEGKNINLSAKNSIILNVLHKRLTEGKRYDTMKYYFNPPIKGRHNFQRADELALNVTYLK